jgi:hypothetical protein
MNQNVSVAESCIHRGLSTGFLSKPLRVPELQTTLENCCPQFVAERQG